MRQLKIIAIFLSFSLINSSSGVLLTGMMFSYLARGLMSLVENSNTVKTVYTTMPSSDMTSTLISQSQSPSSVDTLNTISQVVQALGIGRAIKDLFTEDDCTGSKCRKQKKKKRQRKKKRSDDSSEEDDGKPIFHDTEDYSRYIIRSDKGDPEDIANELLSEDDPMNFYYVMKDTQKRLKKKKQRRTEAVNGSNRLPTHQGQNDRPLRDRGSPRPQPRPSVPAPQMFRAGRLPLFIRYRMRTPGYMRFAP